MVYSIHRIISLLKSLVGLISAKPDNLSTAQKDRTRPKFTKASNITSHSFQGDKASKKSLKKGHSRKGKKVASLDVGGRKTAFSKTHGIKSKVTGQKHVKRANGLKAQTKKQTLKKGLAMKGNHNFPKKRKNT